MANDQLILTLKGIVEGLKAVDLNRVYRESIGEESLKNKFEKTFSKIMEKAQFAYSYAPEIRDETVSQVNNIFQSILNRINVQAGLDNQQYIARKQQFVTEIDTFLSQLQSHWHLFVTAAIEARGLLSDQGFREEYQRTMAALKIETESAIKEAQAEASRIIEETKKISKEIETSARKTAVGISMEEAQKQFGEAQKDLESKVKIWGSLSVLGVIAFLLIAKCFMETQKLPDAWSWQIVYYTAIRVTILTAFAAIATFCLRTLKAHMHMREQNLHRKRIANSMASFVEAAQTTEQQDYILSRLVDTLSTFGNSGLIDSNDDSINQPKINIPSVSVGLTSPK